MLRHQQTSRTGPFFRDYPKKSPSDLKWFEPLEVPMVLWLCQTGIFQEFSTVLLGGTPWSRETGEQVPPGPAEQPPVDFPEDDMLRCSECSTIFGNQVQSGKNWPIDNSCSMILGYTWASYLAGQLFLKSAETRSPAIWPNISNLRLLIEARIVKAALRSAEKKVNQGIGLRPTWQTVHNRNRSAPKCTFISWYCKSYENGWSGGASILGDLHINAP